MNHPLLMTIAAGVGNSHLAIRTSGIKPVNKCLGTAVTDRTDCSHLQIRGGGGVFHLKASIMVLKEAVPRL
jgi:hypothetical protein